MSNTEPLYVAKKSILPAFTIWKILFFWLIVPTVLLIADIIKRKCWNVEFYDTYVIIKSGVINRNESKSIFPKVTAVNTTVNIFGYGDVHVDVIGKWDVSLNEVCDPKGLKNFLENHIVDGKTVNSMGNSPFMPMV